MKKVLVVGAGGFTGGFIVEEGLARGYEVYAGVRETTSRNYLSDPRIKFVVFDFDNPATLGETMSQALPEGEKWDWIIYNLGATKAISFSDFNRVNYEYLKAFTEALKETGKVPEKFLLMSSLSVHGPKHEKDGEKFRETDIPSPNTKYGASKLKAEMLLQMDHIPYIIFRPTGIYGPRDKDYYLMLKSISKGFDFSAGYKKQMLTFIYVEDLARAVFDALEKAPVGNVYIISEDKAYTQKEFRRIAAEELGKKSVVSLPMPLWAVKTLSSIAEKWGVARMKPSTLNRDKYNIMKQRNWDADTGKAKKDFGFSPRVSLREGINKAVEWYRQQNML